MLVQVHNWLKTPSFFSSNSLYSYINPNTQLALKRYDNFSHVYMSNDAIQTAKLHDEFKIVQIVYDKLCWTFQWLSVLDVFSKLEVGKATPSFLKPEHILYGSPRLAQPIHLLFIAMIKHSYVLYKFMDLQLVSSNFSKNSGSSWCHLFYPGIKCLMPHH